MISSLRALRGAGHTPAPRGTAHFPASHTPVPLTTHARTTAARTPAEPRARTPWLRGATVAILVGLALLMGAGPASAHNTLVSADPGDGAALAAGPERVTLTFDQPVQGGFNTITVTGPGDTRWNLGDVTTSGNTATTAIGPLGPAGDYVVGYRVVSADGHPVSGSLRFRLTQAGTGTPQTVETAQSGPDDGGMPVWPWVVAAVLLLAGGVVIALRVTRATAP